MITWTLTLEQLLQTIAQSQDGAGNWVPYPTMSSVTSFSELPTLSETLTQAQTLRGLEPTVGQIQDLSTQLQATIAAPATLRRVPIYSASKGALNPHRVLRGATTPWRPTTPAIRPAHGRRVTLVLPGSWHTEVPAQTILWSGVATLALADTLQQAGYHVTLASAIISKRLFVNHADDTCTLVRLRSAGDPWSLHAVAVTAQATFCRKLLFRFWETRCPEHGALNASYGQVEMDPTLVQVACLEADPHLGQCIIGAGPWSAVANELSARNWIQGQLATITAQAAF